MTLKQCAIRVLSNTSVMNIIIGNCVENENVMFAEIFCKNLHKRHNKFSFTELTV